MNSILNLLTEKNHFLDKFSALNETEIMNFIDGDFDNLDAFYNSRERILGILSEIDLKIEEETIFEADAAYSPEEKKKIIYSLDYKNEVVKKILAQDLQILSLIEEAKSHVIKELTGVKASRKAHQSYKSNKHTSSDKINEKV